MVGVVALGKAEQSCVAKLGNCFYQGGEKSGPGLDTSLCDCRKLATDLSREDAVNVA